ncbi:MAG: glycosyltransferase family 2 protein [Candidatus Sulfopaludibacter sp.]|nr:glycosyltransferase family 2 protein [Candidatus Sulfopaludibacter sp.]
MKLLVVILNYRVADLTIECLRSLSSELANVAGSRAVVVDNGSGDDSVERLRQAIMAHGWDAWVELVTLSRNLGFTGGNNRIVRTAMASLDPPQYVLLLNADTLTTADAISRLVRFMDEHPRAGIAGTRLEFADGRPQGSPFRFPSMASEFDRGLGIGVISRWLANRAGSPAKPLTAHEVDWVAGASMIIRREVIDTLGLLDERFFAYFEDTDYCLNARRAGWSTWYVPESLIIHFEGSSSGIGSEKKGRLPAYWFQARRWFFLKNYGAVYAALVDAAFLLGCTLGWLRRTIQRKRNPNPSHFIVDFMSHSVLLTGFKAESGALNQTGRHL